MTTARWSRDHRTLVTRPPSGGHVTSARWSLNFSEIKTGKTDLEMAFQRKSNVPHLVVQGVSTRFVPIANAMYRTLLATCGSAEGIPIIYNPCLLFIYSSIHHTYYICFCPCRAKALLRNHHPGRRFALPWARRSLPLQGAQTAYSTSNDCLINPELFG